MGKCGGDEGWLSGFAGRIEVRESATGRREWPEAVKGRIVRESLEPGALVKDVARRHGIAPQQLTTWRRAAREGRLALPEDPVAEDGFGFAALVLAEEPAPAPVEGPASAPAVEIVADGVVIRLDGATPATRIAEIVSALGTGR
ncbi:IS66-like element accessory protein TnpA [Rhodosalinus sp.]|uniref:IS66-like element accessory protein TnpA n=1 Tax=Rhodosalinus sp. TaxID=2047741 RepID=UPI003979CF45